MNTILLQKQIKPLAVMQGLRPLFSLRSSGLHHSKENLKNRLARCLVFRDHNWELKVTSR